VTALLPSLHAPTVAHLTDSDWLAVESVVDRPLVRTLIPRLKEMGAEGILELAVNKIC
jgi:ATP phosphoribosyltransferase